MLRFVQLCKANSVRVKTIILGLLGIAISTFSSCGKLETKQEFKLADGFKDYLEFKEGTEWIFMKQSDTTITDTATVQGYQTGKMVYDAFTQEFFNYNILCRKDSSYLVRAVADRNQTDRISIIRDDPSFNIGVQLFKDQVGYAVVDGRGDILTTLDTFSVAGRKYSQVLKVELNPNNPVFNTVYLVPGLGIVRKDCKTGVNWYLKKAQIIK